jgi:hypothetical protein
MNTDTEEHNVYQTIPEIPHNILQYTEIESDDVESEVSETDDETDISSIPSLMERLCPSDICDMEEQIKKTIDDYVCEHMTRFSSPDFATTLVQEITESLMGDWIHAGICMEEDYTEISEMVEQSRIEYFEMREIPFREEPTVDTTALEIGDTFRKLERIRTVHQPPQRTTEWYETRYNLITASNAWKIFSSAAQYNSLIYEKCKPLEIRNHSKSSICIDSNNTLQHGIRYEPLSIMLYEQKYNTKVSDIGCIPHSKYAYIGASPDGIITGEGLPRYGRMLEVKNIVNRDITGVPLESYWIQMQLQMEVCDLDECDFLETRFIQLDDTEPLPDDDREKGIVLYFYPRISIGEEPSPDVHPEYAYMPLGIAPQSPAAEEWIRAECIAREKHVLYKKTYWIMDQLSCVLVRRNREWFRAAQPKIEEAWNTIVQERITGYEHRATNPAAKKKKIQTEVVCTDDNTTHYIRNMPIVNTICLVKLE